MINAENIDLEKICIKKITSIYDMTKTTPWKFNAQKYARRISEDEFFYQLIFHTHGGLISEYNNGERYEIECPAISLIDIRDYSYFNIGTELPYHFYAISFQSVHNIFPESVNKKQLLLHPRNTLKFEELFIEAQDIYTRKIYAWPLEVKSVVYKILSMFFRQYQYEETKDSYSRNMLTAKRIIEKKVFNENINIAALAKEIGLCPEYFTRLFKKSFGVSPKRYIINAKLDRAATLLTQTNKPIYEICEICFFNDSSYFNKKFSERFKMTPVKYRKTKSSNMEISYLPVL